MALDEFFSITGIYLNPKLSDSFQKVNILLIFSSTDKKNNLFYFNLDYLELHF